MQASPGTNNVRRAIRVPRTLDAKVQERYRLKNFTIKDAYILALQFATKDVELPPETYLKIARMTATTNKKQEA